MIPVSTQFRACEVYVLFERGVNTVYTCCNFYFEINSVG